MNCSTDPPGDSPIDFIRSKERASSPCEADSGVSLSTVETTTAQRSKISRTVTTMNSGA